METHPDFESMVSTIQSVQDIEDKIIDAFDFPNFFERKTTPWEIKTWNYDELQKITIDVEKIDRIYYTDFNRYEDSCDCELIFRIDDNDKGPLYVQLEYSEGLSSNGFDDRSSGYMLISKHPEFFVLDDGIPEEVKTFILNDNKNKTSKTSFDDKLLKTHLKFQTFENTYDNATKIQSEINGALFHQNKFTRKTTEQEKYNWIGKKLQNFKINVERIDRLYYISFNRYSTKSKYELVARMEEEEGNYIYVRLFAIFRYIGSDLVPNDDCIITISKNRTFFLNEIRTKVPTFVEDRILKDNDNDE